MTTNNANASNWHTFITPFDSSVKQYFNRNARGNTKYNVAKNLYNTVRDDIEYRDDISFDEWTMPRQTIARKWGDCEDQAALLTSLYLLGGYESKMLIFHPLGWEISHVATLLKDYPKIGWNLIDPTRTHWEFENKTSYSPINADLFIVSIDGSKPLPEAAFVPLFNLQANLVLKRLLPSSRPATAFLEQNPSFLTKNYRSNPFVQLNQ